MKLLNKSIVHLSLILLAIISIWAAVFYFNLKDEITESVDEGLENYKRHIVHRAMKDTTLLSQKNFDEGFFAIREISREEAVKATDIYADEIVYMQDADDEEPEPEPVRMLTTTFENHDRYFELRIINPMVEEDDLIEESMREAIWLYLILIASIILINNFVLQRLWKPFYSLLGQLQDFRIGTIVSFPETDTQTKEFRDLQKALHDLLGRSQETFLQQKRFIENASHELQTPLAITTGKLELLIEKGNLENHQAESLSDVLAIVERLVRLNKALLLLTKIENKQFLDNQRISINEIVSQTAADLEEIAEFRQVEISVSDSADVSVEMDASLAHILISNLMRNAIFHNIPGGSVSVEIFADRLCVSNTGSAQPLDETRLFDRFFKADPSKNGTGLGLSIVKAICVIYGFSVRYSFENQKHSFTVGLRQM